MKVNIIGAGLAGCEAALQAANSGIKVKLYEMKPQKFSEAHSYSGFGELVCSNSLKADRLSTASGLLKAEMRKFGSVVLNAAEKTKVPAGGALAVNRTLFSDEITKQIENNENIEIIREELTEIPKEGYTIIATGPLTSEKLSKSIAEVIGQDYLSFYDAAAPIVKAESIDFTKAFFASRYGKGEADYINCPMDKAEYETFYNALVKAEIVQLKEFEKEGIKVYEGCMPVEVLAKRGAETLRYGALKPVGLTDPRTGKRPWAVVQLRKENKEGTMYNLVGFQTNLKFPEQKRVFSLIPGLEQAEFVRFGVMHRNTFINSPKLLKPTLQLKTNENIFFAGQITGVEGYVESAMAGIVAGRNLVKILKGETPLNLPRDTIIGALIHYITDESVTDFQPMGANMGLLPPLQERIKNKQERYTVVSERALKAYENLKL